MLSFDSPDKHGWPAVIAAHNATAGSSYVAMGRASVATTSRPSEPPQSTTCTAA